MTFSILGSAAESLTFSYLGLCFFTFSPGELANNNESDDLNDY